MRMMTKKLAIMLVAALIASPALVQAEIYTWVDENGVSHYSDQPEIGAIAVPVRGGRPVPPQPQEANEEESDEEKLAELRQDQCERARKRFQQFSDSTRIVETDEFGKKHELSSEERLTAIAKARGDVETYCGEQTE